MQIEDFRFYATTNSQYCGNWHNGLPGHQARTVGLRSRRKPRVTKLPRLLEFNELNLATAASSNGNLLAMASNLVASLLLVAMATY